MTEQIRWSGQRAAPVRADPAAVVAAVQTVAAERGRLDIPANNAGSFQAGPMEQLGLTDFEQTVAVNIRAPFVASQPAVRHMPAGGRVINIGSNMAERAVVPGFSLYAMSRTALIG